MKIKIIRTIVFYLGILIFSYSIYLKHGFSEGFGFFWCNAYGIRNISMDGIQRI